MQAKAEGSLPEHIQLSIIGLESNISLEKKELAAERRAEIVEEVLAEQEEQWEDGCYDPDQIRLVSIRCSSEAALEAFERAIKDSNSSSDSFSRIFFSDSVDSESSVHQEGLSPWGTGIQAAKQSTPVAPRRQISRKHSSYRRNKPRKEPSWRTTLTKQESSRSLERSLPRADTQPMLPRKVPSQKKLVKDVSSADCLPVVVTRRPSVEIVLEPTVANP